MKDGEASNEADLDIQDAYMSRKKIVQFNRAVCYVSIAGEAAQKMLCRYRIF